MDINIKNIFKHKTINKWGLFYLISIPMSLAMINAMMEADMSSGEGLSHMISYSVRWAVPFIYLVVAASSIQILFPGQFSAWWMRNRKYIGMCFAVGMAWQGVFIFIVSTFFRDHYFEDIYFFRDEIEGSVGYIFLAAMVLTSFDFGRKYVDSQQWKLVHKGGIYFLWAYPFSVYWWNLSYYPTLEPFNDPRIIDYIFYWAGFIAFVLRIAAWGKKRQQVMKKQGLNNNPPFIFKAFGGSFIALGLIASATGIYWQQPVTAFLTSTLWAAELELWVPFWPFEPYLPLFIIGAGVMLITKPKPQVRPMILF